MKKALIAALLALTVAAGVASVALAHEGRRWARGPHCGGAFSDSATCSFRYAGGQLYLGGNVVGAGLPEGAAAISLEGLDPVTGARYVLLSCVTPGSGACAAGGSYDVLEHLRKGDKLFCVVEGLGAGNYECGTMRRR